MPPQHYEVLAALYGYPGLALFPRGLPLDAQPAGGSRAYGNYVYGVYLATLGTPIGEALTGANLYAAAAHYDPGVPMSRDYPNLPQANVDNITNGWLAHMNGTVCTVSR